MRNLVHVQPRSRPERDPRPDGKRNRGVGRHRAERRRPRRRQIRRMAACRRFRHRVIHSGGVPVPARPCIDEAEALQFLVAVVQMPVFSLRDLRHSRAAHVQPCRRIPPRWHARLLCEPPFAAIHRRSRSILHHGGTSRHTCGGIPQASHNPLERHVEDIQQA